MLIAMYRYVTEKREEILQKLDIKTTEEMHRKARSIWNRFPDESYKASLAGIDSSWNLIPYHGFYLYAVDGVSVTSDCSYLVEPRYTIGIDTLEYEEDDNIIYNPSLMLSSIGMMIEYELIKDSIKKVDLVLVDGSLQARMYDRRRRKSLPFYEYAKDILKRDDVIFISKRSESRSILNGPAGDIYYFDHATDVAGYSDPYYDKNITIVYAKLADNVPCLKIEFGMRLDKDAILDRLLCIKESCISGYPYVLNLAHEQCTITNEDMKSIESLLSLVEIKGREVLEH